jgi:polyphosphate glucokinase
MAQAFAEIVNFFEYSGPVGCGFPAIVKNGTAEISTLHTPHSLSLHH